MTDAQDPPTSLQSVVDAIEFPDSDASFAAAQRQAVLCKPAGSLGWLEDLSVWVAGVQGQCPPHDFRCARLVIFAGDHGIATRGVSAYPSEVTAQMLASFASGGAAANVLASVAGVGVRVIDMAVDADTDTPPHGNSGTEEGAVPAWTGATSRYKVRRSSGRIDVEDALTPAEATAAFDAGVAIADEEIDSGADLVIVGDMGIGNTTAASALISVLTDTEPVRVIGRGTGIDDAGWIRKCAAVRDARRRAWPYRNEPLELLATTGGADFAAMTGFMLQAAARRTPILLDGVVVSAAALVAQSAAPAVVRWMQAGHLSVEPAHPAALTRLGLTPMLDLGMRLGEGSGALVAVPIVRAAVRVLAEMATFEEAAVTSLHDSASTPDSAGEIAVSAGATAVSAGRHSAQETPADPVEPAPIEPVPIEPAPIEPAPIEPAPNPPQ